MIMHDPLQLAQSTFHFSIERINTFYINMPHFTTMLEYVHHHHPPFLAGKKTGPSDDTRIQTYKV